MKCWRFDGFEVEGNCLVVFRTDFNPNNFQLQISLLFMWIETRQPTSRCIFLGLFSKWYFQYFVIVNPLTPVPPVTARDESWPFFLFRRHHFWPKLAPSILTFCRRKRSFQWCPDQSDRPKGALDTHKNAQKVEWKTQTKISCPYTWLLHARICSSRWRFLRSFLPASKPSRRSIAVAKRREKEKK